MGKLVIKMIKSTQVIIDSNNYITYSENSNDTTIYNPSEGYIDIKPFDFSLNTGIELSNKKNLSRNMPRISIGSKNLIDMSLNLSMTKSNLEADNLTPTDLIDSLLYLSLASDSDYIGLLYWLPSNDDDISSGQCKSYYESIYRVLHYNKWNSAKLSKSDSGYVGSYDYEPYAIPIKINGAILKETSNTKAYMASIKLTLITKEK